jgi:ankyrin repeat protein
MPPWERDALLNAVTSDGKTPLAYATISGALQIVNLLCTSTGIDINRPDSVDESTPVHWAGEFSATVFVLYTTTYEASGTEHKPSCTCP